jgi:hypothetical protein
VSGLVLATAAAAAGGSPVLYTTEATEACLQSTPGAVVGMPPATPTVPPALFVTFLPADAVQAPVDGRVAAWRGRGPTYEGVTITFFQGAPITPEWLNALESVYGGGTVYRNVVLAWDQKSTSASFRETVMGCLKAAVGAAPAAGFATFAGAWGGHTRGLTITSSGRGLETTDDGCCTHEYRLGFQIVSVSGTLTRATATYRVRSYTRFHDDVPDLRAGQTGKLVLKDGIVTNTLTRTIFCSEPAWGATGACGA